MCGNYATCEQLLKHIQAYESAGLQTRSRKVINNLKRCASEMGCYDLDEKMSGLVSDNYDMTGEFVFKPSVTDDFHSVLDELIYGEDEDETPTPTSSPVNDFHSVLDEIGGAGQTGLIPIGGNTNTVRTNCGPCKGIAREITSKLAKHAEITKKAAERRAEIVERVKRLKNGAPFTEEEIAGSKLYGITTSAEGDFAVAAGVMSDSCRYNPVFFWYINILSGYDDTIRDLEDDLRDLINS